jgi:hypothetical protein
MLASNVRGTCAFNIAGLAQPPEPTTDLDVSVVDRVISVDLHDVFLCMKHEPLTTNTRLCP